MNNKNKNLKIREEGVENVVIMLVSFMGLCGFMTILAIVQAITGVVF